MAGFKYKENSLYPKYTLIAFWIARHFLFWLGYFMLDFLVFGYFYDYDFMIKDHLNKLPGRIIISYFTIYYLIPIFIIKQKKYFAFITYFLASSFFILFIHNCIKFWNDTDYAFYNPYLIFKYALYSYPVVGLVVAIKYARFWYTNQLLNERLKKEKLEAELKMLKAQINPHFLFNTINTIYSQVLEKSSTSTETILKLSEILSYILYEAKSDFIPIEKEISLLKKYLSLEKIRFGDGLHVAFKTGENVHKCAIPPLLLLPLIENSIKHSASPKWIDIDITLMENILKVNIGNNSNSLSYNNHEPNESGIGIENVKKRLALLYPKSNILETIDFESSFLVRLEIDTNEPNNLIS